MYADTVTRSMKCAIDETNRRREIQQEFNKEHGITPTSVKKKVHDVIEATQAVTVPKEKGNKTTVANRKEVIAELTLEMKKAAELLQFELAAQLRDEIKRIEAEEG